MRRSLGILVLTGALAACLDAGGPLIVDRIAIQAPRTDLKTGESVPFTIIALDPAGRVVVGYTTIWSSNVPSVAIVTGTGVVIGRKDGQTWIKAEVQQVADSVLVTVTEPTMERPIGR